LEWVVVVVEAVVGYDELRGGGRGGAAPGGADLVIGEI
jgi:hypothetical protein